MKLNSRILIERAIDEAIFCGMNRSMNNGILCVTTKELHNNLLNTTMEWLDEVIVFDEQNLNLKEKDEQR